MSDQDYNKYSKGSSWRKWDLHLHTPYTNMNGYSATNSEFIGKIKEEGISVVALTNYFKFKDEEYSLQKELERNNITAFLNLELRVSYTNSDSNCCDVHVIFSNDITSVDITKFLTKLNLNVGAVKKMALDIQQCDMSKATVEFEHLIDVLNDESLGFEGRFFVGFLSRGHGHARTSSNYEKIYGQTDFLIHSSDSQVNIERDRDFWLANGRALFQSSDAHKIDDIGAKYSWVKSDPTFEGLKQVIYEPEERISVQLVRPDQKPNYQVIERIVLSDSETWSGTIYLNENLNTIIGGRSTGKSSLLASIANKLGKFESSNPDYVSHIIEKSASVDLFWLDGKSGVERDIDYFPQSHMYTLAYSNIKRNELIKNIIKKKDCDNLLGSYTATVLSKKRRLENLISELFSLGDEINLIKRELNELGDVNGIIAEIDKLTNEINLISGSVSIEGKREFEITQELINSENNTISVLMNLIDDISNIKNISVFSDVSIPALIANKSFKSQVEMKLKELQSNFNDAWGSFLGSMNKKTIDEITLLEESVIQLQLNPNYMKGIKILNDNALVNSLSKRLDTEKRKFIEISNKSEVLSSKELLTSTLIDEISLEHQCYKELAVDLSQKLRFSESDLDVTLVCTFDRERIDNILSEQLIQRSREQKQLVVGFCEQYEINPKSAVEELIKLSLKDGLQCKSTHTPQSVLTQVLSANSYKQDYELTYQNDNFHQMSQGKQSFVILKLLLEFSEKTCPVLIDQPEDSLDNRAIYNELVQYLKQKKKDRQIIIVTHNANVVVSADAEQIIVANQNDVKMKNRDSMRFQYVTGGIEHTISKRKHSVALFTQGIRQHICDVLEGGSEAFRKREQKYQLDKNSMH